MNRIFKVFTFIFVLIFSLITLNLWHYVHSISHKNDSGYLIIKKGYSSKKIAKELAKIGVIEHPYLFYLSYKIFFKSVPLQAGEYSFPAHSSIKNIIEIMNKGMVIIHKMTLPEGITYEAIINKVNQESTLTGAVKEAFEEGDILADTYNFTYGEDRNLFLKRIYYKSQKIIDSLWNARPLNSILHNKKEAVILASIIEKETGIIDEKPRIAGVFTNRLKQKIRLQADPTVIYGVTKGKYILTRPLSNKDLKMQSPYNSYIHIGLPPTAIASPGIAALIAAINPLETKELYFVADGKGGHNFSVSLTEHNQHVNNYRNNQQETK
jgi:UPF0755 protein